MDSPPIVVYIIHRYNGICVGPTLLENVKSKCIVTTKAYVVQIKTK